MDSYFGIRLRLMESISKLEIRIWLQINNERKSKVEDRKMIMKYKVKDRERKRERKIHTVREWVRAPRSMNCRKGEWSSSVNNMISLKVIENLYYMRIWKGNSLYFPSAELDHSTETTRMQRGPGEGHTRVRGRGMRATYKKSRDLQVGVGVEQQLKGARWGI